MQATKRAKKAVSKEPKVRRLKIQPKYRFNQYREAVISPEIKLCGAWLEQLGFHCEKSVLVIPGENMLVIKVAGE